jgi:hypothetical protein
VAGFSILPRWFPETCPEVPLNLLYQMLFHLLLGNSLKAMG